MNLQTIQKLSKVYTLLLDHHVCLNKKVLNQSVKNFAPTTSLKIILLHICYNQRTDSEFFAATAIDMSSGRSLTSTNNFTPVNPSMNPTIKC